MRIWERTANNMETLLIDGVWRIKTDGKAYFAFNEFGFIGKFGTFSGAVSGLWLIHTTSREA